MPQGLVAYPEHLLLSIDGVAALLLLSRNTLIRREVANWVSSSE